MILLLQYDLFLTKQKVVYNLGHLSDTALQLSVAYVEED